MENKKTTLKKTTNVITSHWKITLLILIIGGGIVYNMFLKDSTKTPEYIIETSIKRDVIREISVNGKIIPKETRTLYSSVNEDIIMVLAEENQLVQKGDALVQFDTSNLTLQVQQAEAQLLQAQARLNQQLAGATSTDIALARKDIETARVALNAAKENVENIKEQNRVNLENADLAIKTAEKGVKNSNIRFQNTLNTNKTNDKKGTQQLQDALEKGYIQYRNAWASANQARTSVNSIIRKDANENESLKYGYADFGNKNSILKKEGESLYTTYAQKIQTIGNTYKDIQSFQIENIIESLDAMRTMEGLMNDAQSLVRNTAKIIDATTQNGTASLTTINQARVDINLVEQSVSTAFIAIQSAIQTIESAQINIESVGTQSSTTTDNVRSDFDNSAQQMEQAQSNKTQVITQGNTALLQAENEIKIKEKNLEKANAAFNKVVAEPRDIDIATNQAAIKIAENELARIQLLLEKATLTSPIDGVVVQMNAKTGELPNGSMPLVVINDSELEIKADISETDIGDISVGQKAKITFDAFSSQDIYTGTITKRAYAETVVQGVIYYEVTLELDDEQEHDTDRILSGMTADIDLQIDTRENVYAIEPQSIIYENGIPHIRIMKKAGKNNEIEKRPVTLGLEGNTYIEITEGLKENEQIILYEESPFRSPFGQ